jgi:hypothetical protein
MIHNDAELRAYLGRLAKLGAPLLRVEWAKVYQRPAPRRISRDLLLRGIAYRVQEEMYGGLEPRIVKALLRIADAARNGAPVPEAPKAELPAGVRLLREWKGVTHIVEVVPEGYAWRGKTYRTLSMIARAITGTHWSGPRFFGLHDKRRRGAKRDKLAESLK